MQQEPCPKFAPHNVRQTDPISLVDGVNSLLEKSAKGGLIAVVGLNLGGSVDPLPNAVAVVEAAVEKQAAVVLMPVSARRALLDLSDDMATRVNVMFYSDAADGC